MSVLLRQPHGFEGFRLGRSASDRTIFPSRTGHDLQGWSPAAPLPVAVAASAKGDDVGHRVTNSTISG